MTIYCKNCRKSTPTVFVYWIPLPGSGNMLHTARSAITTWNQKRRIDDA